MCELNLSRLEKRKVGEKKFKAIISFQVTQNQFAGVIMNLFGYNIAENLMREKSEL